MDTLVLLGHDLRDGRVVQAERLGQPTVYMVCLTSVISTRDVAIS
jgi:hypothetical protein